MDRLESLLLAIHPATLTGALVYGGLLFGVGVVGSLVIRSAARTALHRDTADPMAIGFLRPLAQFVLWTILLVFYAHLIPQLRAVGTAMLAGASVISIVLGVAAQSTLGNLIAGISLLVYRPFRTGDRLQVSAPTGLESGVVEAVTLGHTVLQTFDNRRIVMPNSVMNSQTTVNLTSVTARIMAAIPIGIAYTADVEAARQILLAIAGEHAEVTEVVGCPLIELGASSVTLSLRAWCPDPMSARAFEWHVYEEAKRRFDAAGIEIPYPYRNVLVRQVGTTA